MQSSATTDGLLIHNTKIDSLFEDRLIKCQWLSIRSRVMVSEREHKTLRLPLHTHPLYLYKHTHMPSNHIVYTTILPVGINVKSSCLRQLYMQRKVLLYNFTCVCVCESDLHFTWPTKSQEREIKRTACFSYENSNTFNIYI